MKLKIMEMVVLIIGTLFVGFVVIFGPPTLYDIAKTLYLNYTAKPEPVLNII